MSENLRPNDPYQGMSTAEKGIRPEFLSSSRDDKSKNDSNKVSNSKDSGGQTSNEKDGEQGAKGVKDESRGAANELKNAEKSAEGGGLYKGKDNLDSVRSGEKSGGLFSGSGKSKDDKKGKNGKVMKISAAVLVVFGIVTAVVGVGIVNLPSILIGTVDYNLQDSLGFSDTVAILEKQAEFVTAEMMANGEVPELYANDLASNGIDIGQVTASHRFVRTNTYIADIDKLDEIAATGEYYVNGDEGELVALFNGEIVTPEKFVATVESNPKMYMAYSKGLDISARFFYSSEVSKVYEEMGISRGAFNEWQETGNEEKDKESFYEILNRILDNDANIAVNGYDKYGEEENKGLSEEDKEETASFSMDVPKKGDASSIVSDVANRTKGTNATKKAAELLNMVVSSGEPIRAASAFMAIEEPIQRARIEGNGPVNLVVDTMMTETPVTYIDVNTGEEITKKVSIFETDNFAAAVSGSKYSKSEAANFSRDRVLKVTDSADSSIINDTTVASNGKDKTNILVEIGFSGSADADVLSKATDSISLAVSQNNADTFQSVVGGNRIVEGGSVLSNTINLTTLGAMPSDAGAVARYHHEAKEILARRAEAERATMSPFDISSPNTFLGSLVRTMSMSLMNGFSSSSKNSPIMNKVAVIGDMVGSSFNDLMNGAVADGNDEDFLTTMGENCVTVNSAANVEGDIYCTSHNTISTKYMNYTKNDWKNSAISGSFDDSGNIDNGSGLSDFITLGMGRGVTVGVESAEVCENWKEVHQGAISKFFDTLSRIFDLYESCSGVDDSVSTGAKYTLSSSNSDMNEMEYYSGYVLYDTVSSLLGGSQGSVARYKEEYYKAHPRDNSVEGVISRRTGLTKGDVEIALAYADYLNVIAKYNPKDRYSFTQEKDKMPVLEEAETVRNEIYYMWKGRTEYADVRNRSFVV